jgi:tetratricopeptide (TPR) repeat protein/4-amino-4-deoxy-L-arabinose transferase-like glycosyltransferase
MALSAWPAAILVWLAAFGVRLLYIHQSQASPFFDFPLVDAKTYTEMAARLALEGQWRGDPSPFWQPPLYPYFLALVYKVNGPGYWAPRLVQAAIGALSCALLYLLGRRLFSAGVGLAAAGLAALYGPLIFFEAEFLPPVLAVFLDLLVLLSLLRAASGGQFLISGLLLGIAALCVPNILLFLSFALLWVFWQSRPLSSARRWSRLGLLAAGTALALAPVALRNYWVGGERVLISTNAGINFYIGNNAGFEKTVRLQPGPAWRALVDLPRREAGITRPGEQSDYFFNKSWEFIRSQPGAFLKLLVYKTYLFWHGHELGRNQDLYHAREYSSLLRLLLWESALAFPFGLLAPLALVGIGLAWRAGLHRRPGPALLLLFALSYALSVVLFFAAARYRLPVVPVLLLFAVYGVAQGHGLLRQGAFRPLAGAGGALLVLLVGCNLRQGRLELAWEADTYHRLGFAYQQKGLQANAIGAYQKALELDPGIEEARFNLASLYARQGRYDRAIAQYGEFVRRFPQYLEARYALGNALLFAGRYQEAIAQYEVLLDAQTELDRAAVQSRLAYAYVQSGRPEEAVRTYRELLAERPDSVLARYQLAQFYQAQERLAEARAEYAEILRRDSTQAEARYRLARALFAEGRSAEAKAHLESLLALDPNSVRARWLLAAQYAVEHRGEEALEQAEAILRIQPDHVQANRLAGHLRVIQGDTLQGVERLELFKKYYVEERQEEILEMLKERWKEQFEGVF